jgi:hypothetical protein
MRTNDASRLPRVLFVRAAEERYVGPELPRSVELRFRQVGASMPGATPSILAKTAPKSILQRPHGPQKEERRRGLTRPCPGGNTNV